MQFKFVEIKCFHINMILYIFKFCLFLITTTGTRIKADKNWTTYAIIIIDVIVDNYSFLLLLFIIIVIMIITVDNNINGNGNYNINNWRETNTSFAWLSPPAGQNRDHKMLHFIYINYCIF